MCYRRRDTSYSPSLPSYYGGHFGGHRTAMKVLQSRFYWPILLIDANLFVIHCDRCKRTINISRRQEMPLHEILEVEPFDVWGIDFIRHFVPFNQSPYILVAVDYVSKWVEATAFSTNDTMVATKFLKKNIFTRFGTP